MSRRAIAVVTCVCSLATALPARSARAGERDVAPAAMEEEAPPSDAPASSEDPAPLSGLRQPVRILLTPAEALALTTARPLAPFTDPTREIRLSRGAKTAIIVGAIVVGVLLIVGVVAVAKPHKL